MALLLGSCLLGLPLAYPQATWQPPISAAQNKLDGALEDLAALRETIRKERAPLAQELRLLQAEVKAKRQTAARSGARRDKTLIDLDTLKAQLQGRREAAAFTRAQLDTFNHTFESLLHISELQHYQEPLGAWQAVRYATGFNPEASDAGYAVVHAALDRLKRETGGRLLAGEVVLPSGLVAAGTLIRLGPLTYFSDGEGHTGIVQSNADLQPHLLEPKASAQALIRDFVAQQAGSLPVDPSLGQAIALEQRSGSLFQHIAKGGIWIWPILFLGLLAGAIALSKALAIYRIARPDRATVDAILKAFREGGREAALQRAQAQAYPVGDLLSCAVAHAHESKEALGQALQASIAATRQRLEWRLPWIAIAIATAPLLGLLGTVTGMIATFELMTQFGTGDAQFLASGISEALVTTEFGLFVAIPALIAHTFLVRKINGVIGALEGLVPALSNGLTGAAGPRQLNDEPGSNT